MTIFVTLFRAENNMCSYPKFLGQILALSVFVTFSWGDKLNEHLLYHDELKSHVFPQTNTNKTEL
jgi:hypothetical protein